MSQPESVTTEIPSSEFGDGYSYCLGLFLAHEWKSFDMAGKEKNEGRKYERPEMWFYGAGDHLFGLTAPPSFTDEEKKSLDEWKSKCLKFRMASCEGVQVTWGDVKDALDEAKRRLLEYDLRNGVPAIKGDWQ